jgi:isopenicillin-N epimerase
MLFSLDPGYSHLNHGSFGAVPISVQRAQQRLREELDANPVRFFVNGLADRIAHTRRHLASFLGADPDGSALVDNATTGVAVVLNSLDLGPGDEIVMTDHGYGALRLAVDSLARRTGAVCRTVALSMAPGDDEVVDGVLAAVSGRTRLVIVDQVTSPTARVFPVEKIVATLRGSSIPVLVDGAHVPGVLPARVDDIGADFWVGNFHKWAYAPRGTALLTVAAPWRQRIQPLVVSWLDAAGFPANVEWHATADYTPWLAAPAGLYVLRTLGVDAVREHNATLAAYAQQVIGAALGVKAADLPGSGGAVALPMRVVPLPPGVATDETSAAALRHRISDGLAVEIAVKGRRGCGLLRLSAQVYNTAEEYERLARRLPSMLPDG